MYDLVFTKFQPHNYDIEYTPLEGHCLAQQWRPFPTMARRRHSSCVYFGSSDPPMDAHATVCNGTSHPWRTRVRSHKAPRPTNRGQSLWIMENYSTRESVAVIEKFVVIVALFVAVLLFSSCCLGLCFLSIELLNHGRVGGKVTHGSGFYKNLSLVTPSLFLHLTETKTKKLQG